MSQHAEQPPKIAILMGSVRPNRFNIQPAQWLYKITQKRSEVVTELIDLREVNLPFLDEPIPPSRHEYSKDHTKKWSEKINSFDGFIFVTPEYNHGVSPVLKNAVDYLWHEWHYKPICFVSYGSLAGGARAVEHWRGISAELKMYDLREQILFPEYYNHLDSEGKYKFTKQQAEQAEIMLDALIFWAENMKKPRKKLQA